MSDADSATSDGDFELEGTFGGDDDDDDDDDDIAPRGAGKRSKVSWRMCDSLLRRGKSTSQIEEWLLERLNGLDAVPDVPPWPEPPTDFDHTTIRCRHSSAAAAARLRISCRLVGARFWPSRSWRGLVGLPQREEVADEPQERRRAGGDVAPDRRLVRVNTRVPGGCSTRLVLRWS